jgi:hypothetical protein
MRPCEHHLGAVKRPKHLVPPAYLSSSPPVPEAEEFEPPAAPSGEEERLDPARYGDWERDGKAVDF